MFLQPADVRATGMAFGSEIPILPEQLSSRASARMIDRFAHRISIW